MTSEVEINIGMSRVDLPDPSLRSRQPPVGGITHSTSWQRESELSYIYRVIVWFTIRAGRAIYQDRSFQETFKLAARCIDRHTLLDMTTRNLNRTWRDVVFTQYQEDLENNAPFPIRYLIYANQWEQDILITIPQRIEVQTFKVAIRDFFRALHTTEDPTYEDEYISVQPRRPVPISANTST